MAGGASATGSGSGSVDDSTPHEVMLVQLRDAQLLHAPPPYSIVVTTTEQIAAYCKAERLRRLHHPRSLAASASSRVSPDKPVSGKVPVVAADGRAGIRRSPSRADASPDRSPTAHSNAQLPPQHPSSSASALPLMLRSRSDPVHAGAMPGATGGSAAAAASSSLQQQQLMMMAAERAPTTVIYESVLSELLHLALFLGAELQDLLTALYLELLFDAPFKKSFALCFVTYYPLYMHAILLDGDGTSAVNPVSSRRSLSLDKVTVQLFTNEQLTMEMVHTHALMDTVLRVTHSLLLRGTLKRRLVEDSPRSGRKQTAAWAFTLNPRHTVRVRYCS